MANNISKGVYTRKRYSKNILENIINYLGDISLEQYIGMHKCIVSAAVLFCITMGVWMYTETFFRKKRLSMNLIFKETIFYHLLPARAGFFYSMI